MDYNKCGIVAGGLVTDVKYGTVSNFFRRKVMSMGPVFFHKVIDLGKTQSTVIDMIHNGQELRSSAIFKESVTNVNDTKSEIVIIATDDAKEVYDFKYLVDYICSWYDEIIITDEDIFLNIPIQDHEERKRSHNTEKNILVVASEYFSISDKCVSYRYRSNENIDGRETVHIEYTNRYGQTKRFPRAIGFAVE